MSKEIEIARESIKEYRKGYGQSQLPTDCIIQLMMGHAKKVQEKRLAEVTDEEIQKIASCLCREDSGVEAFDTLKKWILNLLKKK